MIVSLNGKLIPDKDALAGAVNSAFYYGTGCFETLRAEQGALIWFHEHAERLFSGLDYLGVPKSMQPLKATLEKEIESLINSNQLEDSTAKIRIQVSFLEKNGYAVDPNPGIIQLITAERIKQPASPLHLKTVKTTTVPASCKPPQFKMCNMLHYRDAWRVARNMGADDGILLSTGGFVAETSVANLFWKRGDTVFTPSLSCDILPGIIRSKVIECAGSVEKMEVTEGEFSVSELMKADTVWCTNSSFEICPVRKINDREFLTSDEKLGLLKNIYQKSKESSIGKDV